MIRYLGVKVMHFTQRKASAQQNHAGDIALCGTIYIVSASGGCTPRATRAMARGSAQKIAEEAQKIAEEE